MSILAIERIRVQATATDKEDAIRQAGELLVSSGCVKPAYVAGMLEREGTMSTYLGNGVAIPHGMYENHADVLKTGLSVVQFPAGVLWDEDDEDELAHLVIGIAAKGDEHMNILSNLAEVIEDEEIAEQMAQTSDAEFVLEQLSREASDEDDD